MKRTRGLEVLGEILGSLGPEAREVFVGAELHELSDEDIALALGIPSGTVKSRLRRARAELQAAAGRWRARNRAAVVLSPLMMLELGRAIPPLPDDVAARLGARLSALLAERPGAAGAPSSAAHPRLRERFGPARRPLALLDMATTAAGQGDDAAALAALEQHAARYPSGKLVGSRELLAVQVLLHKGDAQAARSRAGALRRTMPADSPARRKLDLLIPALP